MLYTALFEPGAEASYEVAAPPQIGYVPVACEMVSERRFARRKLSNEGTILGTSLFGRV